MGDVRQLPDFFERGTPNLVITAAGKLYAYFHDMFVFLLYFAILVYIFFIVSILDTIFLRILQIYAQDSNKSLPSYDEILLCSESTTLEQVITVNVTECVTPVY